MLCSGKAAEQTVRFRLQPVCASARAEVLPSPVSLIVRAKSQGNHNRSRGLLGGGESNVAAFKETHHFIVKKYTELTKGASYRQERGSQLLLLML